MKPDNFLHLEYLDYRFYLHCYSNNISADKSFGLLQVY